MVVVAVAVAVGVVVAVGVGVGVVVGVAVVVVVGVGVVVGVAVVVAVGEHEMSDHTIRREKKTIAGETFDTPSNVKHFALDDGKAAFQPPAGADIVTQASLAEIAEDEALLDRMAAEIEAKREAILARLRSGKSVVEPGAFAANVKTNFKQKRVSWREAFVDYNGEAEAAKLEGDAKGGPKEVSSYSLELKRVDGGTK